MLNKRNGAVQNHAECNLQVVAESALKAHFHVFDMHQKDASSQGLAKLMLHQNQNGNDGNPSWTGESDEECQLIEISIRKEQGM
jgi:hypothetical protein